MADFEPYSDEVCAEAIKSFQERLVEADNLMKDDNGMMNYETCWKAMRKEGPMILNTVSPMVAEIFHAVKWMVMPMKVMT